MTVQEIIKKKLKVGEITADIDLAIEEIGQKIRNVCNIPLPCPLPDEINFVYANMVVQLFNYNNSDVSGIEKVTSVTMGKTSYDFETVQLNIDAVIRDNYSDLLKFRRTRK